MHDCLEIGEILNQILRYLPKGSLFSCSLTSRHFSKHALPRLWESIDGIEPLLYSLPDDALAVTPVIAGEPWGKLRCNYFKLLRPLSTQDLEPVLQYISLVQNISVDFNSSRNQDTMTSYLHQMISFWGDKGPFSRLKSLSITNINGVVLHLVQFLLCDNLERITIRWAPISSQQNLWVHERESVMACIGLNCPNLRHLDLYCYGLNCLSAIPDTTYALLPQLSHLTSLHISYVDNRALHHIMGLHELRELLASSYITNTEESLPHTPPSHAQPVLPSLTSLRLSLFPLRRSLDVLNAVISKDLSTVDIDVVGINAPNSWDSLFGCSVFKSTRANTKLKFGLSRQMFINEITPVLEPSTLHPLLDLSSGRLSSLSLNGFVFDLDDSFIRELAKACPGLSELELGTETPSQRRSRLTVKSYVYLVHYCPELVCIGLVIDASKVNPRTSRRPLKDGDRILPLELLRVGDSHIEDPVAVAAVLSGIFALVPDENMPLHAEHAPTDLAEKWSEVQRLIPVFTAVRKQEHFVQDNSSDSGDDITVPLVEPIDNSIDIDWY